MKTKTLIHIFISAFLLFAIPVSSQNGFDNVKFGLRMAMGLSKMSGLDNYTNRLPGTIIKIEQPYSVKPYFPWDFGASMQTTYNGKVLIQTDLTFGNQTTSLKGGELEEIRTFEGIGSYYTTLSLYAGSMVSLGEDTKLVFGLGPYVATNMSDWFSKGDKKYGKNVRPSDMEDHSSATLLIKDADFRSYDAGATAMLGIKFLNVQLSLNYYHGLVNIVKDDYKLHNRSLMLVLTAYTW